MVEIRPYPVPGGVTIDAADLMNSLAEQTGIAGLHLVAEYPEISGLELALPCVWRDEDSLTLYLGDAISIVGPESSRRMRILWWLARPTLPDIRRLWWKLWHGR